jgi:putative spermidine/putrescine transport system ATP-binding protein
VGPSGSGKSTILKIIAGLLDPSGGVVLFDGPRRHVCTPEKRNIGMVFQSYALFPNMTARENVEFGLLVRKVSAAERRRRADDALATVQIAHLAERRIHQLSGGQQQRVALARAVVFAPEILLLDEPLSALDAKIRLELRGELARLLQQFKITAVYVTHDQQEAMSLATRSWCSTRARSCKPARRSKSMRGRRTRSSRISSAVRIYTMRTSTSATATCGSPFPSSIRALRR